MAETRTIALLNELIQFSEDGKIGFAEASTNAAASGLKRLFETRSSECSMAATELRSLVASLGDIPIYRNTIAGAAHRGWSKATAISVDNDVALIEEVERADNAAKSAYAEALASPASKQIHDVVQRQFERLVRNHEELRNLRNRCGVEKECLAE